MEEYRMGDALRKLVRKEASRLSRKLESAPNGTVKMTERVWVKKLDENCYDWGCR